MKQLISGISKKTGLIFVTAVLLLGSLGYWVQTGKYSVTTTTLRTTVYILPETSLDPANIKYSDEFDFIDSLYSTLLRFNQSGKLELQLAESYQANDKTLTMKIREGIKTVDGYLITEKDVEKSFKRLLILNSNTHGKLDNFLELSKYPKNIEDECSCITTTKNHISFHLKNSNLVSSFLIVLASADYSIIPSISINKDTLKISDYKNTTGPYYLSAREKNKVIFKKNNSILYHDNIGADIIEFTEDRETDVALKRLLNNEIDLLPTFYPTAYSKIKDFLTNNEFNVHQSLPINLSYIQFTRRGIKRFNKEQRLIIANYLRNKAIEFLNPLMNYKISREFFSEVGRGSLTPEQLLEIEKINTPAIKDLNTLDISVRCMMLREKLGIEFTQFAKVKNSKVSFDTYYTKESYDQQPDVILHSTDAGFYDSLTLLSYLHYQQIFFDNETDLKNWIINFTELTDETKKEEMINKLHFDMLKSGVVFPIGFSRYYAIARKPWKIDAPKMYAGTPLWMIHKE